MDDILSRQRTFEEQFNSWFDTGLKPILEDNRRRYRMELKDAADRKKRGLSTLPSTKSASVVDRAVERALLEYHGEPEAIAFTAKSAAADPHKDELARWLSDLFHYRAKRTFPFFTWHASSLTAAFTDGMEAALVYWRKESYTVKRKEYLVIDMATMTPTPIPREAYEAGVKVTPELFLTAEVEEEVLVRDSWWIDSLKPGEDLLWDFKAPLLDLNLGEAVLVKATRSLQELEQLADRGVFDKFSKEKAKKYRTVRSETVDKTATVTDPESVDLSDLNRLCTWIYFEKVAGQWMVSFSLEGKEALSSQKPVNDVFFAGRRVNRLPLVLGTHKLKLWEAVGRGEPETIAPLEDELIEHKNALADASRIAIQGRFRVNKDSDINFDDLLNNRIVLADEGEFEKFDTQFNTVDALRVLDSLQTDMAEMVPVGMQSKQLVPRGNGRTLGAVQLALGSQNEKLSVQLITRNQTFLEPLLYLVAQLEFAFETDETILRIAARKAGIPPPETIIDGRPALDLRALDFDVEVQINAGLGSAPRQQKAQNIIQLTQFRQAFGIPTDLPRVAAQLNALAGFEPGAFTPAQPPPPPRPEMKGNVNIDLALLPPQIQVQLVMALLTGQGPINANIQAIQPTGGEETEAAGGGEDDPLRTSGGVEQGGQGGWD
jgi:hypothetical protein